jgi:hypothetical protein
VTYESLTITEIEAVLALVPGAVQEQLKREAIVLAGGLIRDTVAGVQVKDVDIFCHSEWQAEKLATEVSPFVRHTTFAYSVQMALPVQYVYYKDFEDAKDLISQMDFRACCAGIYWDREAATWVGVAVEGFRDDCRARELHFMSQLKDAGKLTALGRALEFAKRGWTLSTDEAVAIITHYDPLKTADAVRHAFRPCYGRQ